MPYQTPSNNNSRNGGRPRARVSMPGQGVYHGPTGTQRRAIATGGRPNRGHVALGRGNAKTGYPLRTRNINFQSGRGRRDQDLRKVILVALAIVVAILLVVGFSSCVCGCSTEKSEPQAEQNALDSRVAAGLTDDLTKRFSAELDRNDKLAQIAANADKYSDQALLELALDEPDAIDFVASYDSASTTGEAVTDSVTKGTAPSFVDWDSRWGAVPYGDHPMAVSGSGPVSLSMACMGLTGSTEQTPAALAQLATSKGAAKGDSGTDASFYEAVADELGLAVKSHQSSSENITTVLDAGTYLLIEAKAGSLTDAAHWVLAVTENSDNTVVVYDPTSPEASSRSWAPSTLAASCDTFLSVTLK